MADGTSAPFSQSMVALLLGVSGVGFLVMLILLAWSPELQSRDRAGPHPYSTSALGYQALYRLLSARDDQVTISRSPQRLENDYDSLKIVTLSSWGMREALEDLYLSEPALVVLPKYDGRAIAMREAWFEYTDLLHISDIESVLQTFDGDASLWRLRTPAKIDTPFGVFRPELGDDMQVLRADSLVPIVSVPGGDLVAQIPGREVYILADPDVMNTAGLASPETARFAVSFIAWLRPSARTPIVFDASLHGFKRSENLLQLVFDVPFVGATLIAFLGFGMIGWAGAIRFGAPERDERAIALGKQALTDNTAGLISMARRESQMAPGYLTLMRRATAKAIGAPKTLNEAELTNLFERLDPDSESDFAALNTDLSTPAASRHDLVEKARRLWRWHMEITHGRK